MKVEVTQHDIDTGARRSCGNCPVALAVSRALAIDVSVGSSSAICLTLPMRVFRFPEFVGKWIAVFDFTGIGEPFSFELDMDSAT